MASGNETFTGADGAAPASPWVTVVNAGGSATIQSNTLDLSSPTSAYAGVSATYGTASFTNLDLTVKITLHTPATEEYPGVGYRMTGGTSGWDAFGNPVAGYEVYLDVNLNVLSWVYTGLGSPVTTAFTYTVGASYWLRIMVVGPIHLVALWADGGSQSGWQITQTEATFTAGAFGLTQQAAVAGIHAYFDELTWLDLPTKVQDIGNQVSNAAATTTVVSFLGATKPQIGDLVAVYCSRDNIITDPLTGDTFSDGTANVWTRVVAGSNVATAGAGVVGVMFTSVLAVAWSGTQTLTWTHPSTIGAMRVEHWTSAAAGLRANGSITATSTAAAPSAALSTLNGDLVLAMEAIEYSTAGTSTADTDTTNGSWSALQGPTATTGTTLAAVKVVSQYKIVTAAGTQTFNPTHSVTASVDTVAIVAAFSAATIPPTSRYAYRQANRRAAYW